MRSAKGFAYVSGHEHHVARRNCIEQLVDMHRRNTKAFPLDNIMDVWEELVAAWTKKLWELLRNTQAFLESVRSEKADVKRVLWCPGPDGAPFDRFPE